MSDPSPQDRHAGAIEYLACMRALRNELDKAMQAISDNTLIGLEESVIRQQALGLQLHALAKDLSAQLNHGADSPTVQPSGDLLSRLQTANADLQNLNRCYAALLRHSSHSAGQMALLFRAFQGQEARHQPLSCQM